MSIFRTPRNLGLAFARIAGERADAPALRFAKRDVSYAELDAAANHAAFQLKAAGAARRRVVAICQEKTKAGYAAMLGCLKLGAPYVNLDPESPQDRIERIFATGRPTVLAVDAPPPEAISRAVASAGVSVVELDQEPGAAAEPPADVERVTAGDVAYLMYTSGSTGMPKGAAITHANLSSFLPWAHRRFDVTSRDVLTGVNPIYFDNSVYDFYAALFGGACLAPFSRASLREPARLVAEVEDRGCTQWFSVPSLLIYLMTLRQLDADSFPAMRQIAFGGEGYPKGELKRLFDLFGARMRIVNVYGPTETTCICSAHDVTAGDFENAEDLPSLGALADNVDGLILDGCEALPDGKSGELCLLGPNVSAGYYNDPERTAAAFDNSPLHPELPTRMYRTGDLVRRSPHDGLLYFVGRKDNQIKHMGYRIELEEIEAALVRLEHVRQAAVVYHRRSNRHGHIVGFLAADGEIDPHKLRESLGEILPSYMIPQEIYQRARLPKNANGKVDRNALLAELKD